MSKAPRPARLDSRSRSCAGQDRLLGQRMSLSPSFSGASGVPHAGQVVGMTNSRSVPSRRSTTGPRISGMTSPALRSTTVSPMRTPLRCTSVALCSVARSTVDPATTTGSMTPNGVTRPVRPTLTWMSRSCGVDLLGRVLEGDGPPRRARGGAEPALHRDLVDLDDDPVDLVLDVVAVLPRVRDEGVDLLDRVDDPEVGGDRHAPRPERGVGLALPRQVEPLALADAVDEHAELTTRGDARVLLPQRSGRRVARVGVGRLARLDQLRVELTERLDREVDLAAHLDEVGHRVRRGRRELGRDAAHRAHVERDVLARAAVAAGQRTGEAPLLVEEVDGQPVDLQLAQVVQLGTARVTRDPRVPLEHLLGRERVVETEHPLEVVDRGEVGGEDRAADLLGGAVGGAQARVGVLERVEPAHQQVVLAVADRRGVAHVVGELVAPRLLGEGLPLVPRVVGHDVAGLLRGGVGRRLAHPLILPQRTDSQALPALPASSTSRVTSSWPRCWASSS